MFEFDQYDSRLHDAPLRRPEEAYASAKNIAELSLLMWGEHCTECSAPACYSTCDVYEARPDTRCRRFTYGMHKNTNFDSFRGYGVEVFFKKWGRLEARGNTVMQPLERVLGEERAIEAAAPPLTRAGNLVRRLSGDPRWNYATWAALDQLGRRLPALARREPRCDAFLLEVYNPMAEAVTAQLSVSVNKPAIRKMAQKPDSIPAPFIAKVTFPQGYSRHQFDSRLWSHVTNSGLLFDVAITPDGDTTVQLVFLATDFVVFADEVAAKLQPSTPPRPNVKCIVWDLDNTIWQGILLEDPNVQLRPGIDETIKRLDELGVLHSIASKNDHASAWERLTELGLADYFLHPRIDWLPKSENIRRIAATLDIGLDTLAFVDDSQFELAEVSRAVPQVTCIDVTNLDAAIANPRFRGSMTADAKNRRQYYQDAILRSQRQVSFGDDYAAFLRSCEIVLDVKSFAPSDFDRVAELVQRTNQLNFSGRKYSREEIAALLDDPSLEKLVLSCADKFGAYGVIGFGMVRRAHGVIRVEDFMLSCRVQGKHIEQAFFDHLTQVPAGDYRRLWVNFKQQARNTPARQVLDALKLEPHEDEGGLSLDLTRASLTCDVVRVTCSTDR